MNRNESIVSKRVGTQTFQAFSYWNASREMVIGIRTLPSGNVSLFSYPDILQSIEDIHNVVSLGVDEQNYLHVTYDMHNDPLKYRRSFLPLDQFDGVLTDPLPMLGTNENQVSGYWFFGSLFFKFRDGKSGNGDTYLYAYDANTKEWSALAGTTEGKLIDGKSSRESAYFFVGLGFDSLEQLHIFFSWRDRGPDPNTNHDIVYVKWDGTNWLTENDLPQPVPITVSNANVVLPVPQFSGLSNVSGTAIDQQNRPHAVYLKTNAGNAQVYHLYYDGTWIEGVVTDTSTPPFATSLSTPNIAIAPDGSARIIYRDPGDGNLIWVYQSLDYVSWERDFISRAVGDWYPKYDLNWWSEESELHMMISDPVGILEIN